MATDRELSQLKRSLDDLNGTLKRIDFRGVKHNLDRLAKAMEHSNKLFIEVGRMMEPPQPPICTCEVLDGGHRRHDPFCPKHGPAYKVEEPICTCVEKSATEFVKPYSDPYCPKHGLSKEDLHGPH